MIRQYQVDYQQADINTDVFCVLLVFVRFFFIVLQTIFFVPTYYVAAHTENCFKQRYRRHLPFTSNILFNIFTFSE